LSERLSKDLVLSAIHTYKTISAKEIAKILRTSIAAVSEVLATVTRQELSNVLDICPHCHRFMFQDHATFKFDEKSRYQAPTIVCTDRHEETKIVIEKQLGVPVWLTGRTNGLKKNLES
jgi:type II secretory ATPase GspE/PulE/Tfp pilus assembly ATPase PilB-like protein